MSARTLQRRLCDAGATYKEILDETRRVLALAYLSTPHHTVNGSQAYLLGFSLGSSSPRAFRRWTGQSPSDWRGCHEAGCGQGRQNRPARAAVMVSRASEKWAPSRARKSPRCSTGGAERSLQFVHQRDETRQHLLQQKLLRHHVGPARRS